MTTTTQQEFTPSITFLNMSGDVTISWRDDEKAKVAEMVERKMKEGYSFFIIRDPLNPPTRGRKKEFKTASDLDHPNAKALKVSNLVNGKSLADDELARAMDAGIIYITREAAPTTPIDTTRRAKTGAEVVEAQSVGVKKLASG